MNFKTPNFWSGVSAVVAIIALILTQLPPISQMVKGTEIEISTSGSIDLWHDLGNIGIGTFVDIYNSGGRTVNVKKVECTILEKDTGKIFTFPIRNYLRDDRYYSLGPITLNPNEHWAFYVNCFGFFTRSELEQVSDLRVRIQTDINEKLDQFPPNERENNYVKIDDKLYQEAVDFFNKKYELTNEGNYQLFIRAISDSDETLKLIGFDFTLFQGNIQGLKSLTEKDYQIGAGILYQTRYGPSVVTIPIEAMGELEVVTTYQQQIGIP